MSQYATDLKVEFTTFVELLRWRALNHPDRYAYIFLADGESEEIHLTYEELDRQARAIAGRLQSLGATGERVLLFYPSGLEYISAFFGCLYAGAIAVSVYPPRLNRHLYRLQTIVDDAQATMALTTPPVLSRLQPLLETAGLQTLQWLATDSLIYGPGDLADESREPSVNSNMLAFLQYTSGSTAEPKGVMISHGDLLRNNRMIQQAFEQTEESVVVSWLPLFHDMGLIGNVLQSLFLGATCVLMSPEAFLLKPFRWLQAISRYKAHTSGGPNFSYDLCARKITPEQRATLDLSCWEVAFNGAEAVRHETLERFTKTFEPCGFHRNAFYPCYGLAEATLFVSGGLKNALPVVAAVHADARENDQVAAPLRDTDTRTLVGCGRTWLDEKILIVDPESLTRCPSNRVGEIWISGPNVAHGYWNRQQETDRTFRAYLTDTGEGPFLRTGDLGFFHDGELFITGRLKDLIIIGGRNHYPEDIEQTAEKSHPLVRPGCCAAFSVEVTGEERLVIATEVERHCRSMAHQQTGEMREVVGAIRQAVAEHHDLRVHAVLLLKPAGLPKTSSGKIQRHACRADFLAGSLNVMKD